MTSGHVAQLKGLCNLSREIIGERELAAFSAAIEALEKVPEMEGAFEGCKICLEEAVKQRGQLQSRVAALEGLLEEIRQNAANCLDGSDDMAITLAYIEEVARAALTEQEPE